MTKIEPRMHDLALKGAAMQRPVSAGVHTATPDGLVRQADSATQVVDPYLPTEPSTEHQDSEDLAVGAAELVEAVADAIAGIDPARSELWTKNKGPKVTALEAVLGFQITEAERDSAWLVFNQRG